jgi:hypothetical protein
MTKYQHFILKITRWLATKEIAPNASNADYKLVIMDKTTQKCVIHYFFTMKDAVKFASPPNLFLGDGYDYFIYHRNEKNKESFVKLNDSTKTNNYYGSNTHRSYQLRECNSEAILD